MACSLSPSVTLWGTTQIVQTTSYYTTWTTVFHRYPGVDVVDGKPELKGPVQTQTLSSLVETVVTVPASCRRRPSTTPVRRRRALRLLPYRPRAVTTAATPDLQPRRRPPRTRQRRQPQRPAAPDRPAPRPLQVRLSVRRTSARRARSRVGRLVGPRRAMSRVELVLGRACQVRRPFRIGCGRSWHLCDRLHIAKYGTLIAAGIAGAVVGIILLILFFLWCRRRRHRNEVDEWDEDIFTEKPAAEGREPDGDTGAQVPGDRERDD